MSCKRTMEKPHEHPILVTLANIKAFLNTQIYTLATRTARVFDFPHRNSAFSCDVFGKEMSLNEMQHASSLRHYEA